MANSRTRVYLDACVLLAYVGDEEDRSDTVGAILDDAEKQRIVLFTSVISVAEVAYIPPDPDDQPPDGRQPLHDPDDRIDQLWTPESPISLTDVSQALAHTARSVIRRARETGVRGIRSIDAVHLASAQLHQCDRFFTYENEVTRQAWNSLINAEVSEPFSDTPRLGLA